MTTKHIHAEAMLEYAKDAMLTDKPWELWEYMLAGFTSWFPLEKHPSWDELSKYRRKPKVKRYLIVNGIEVEQTDVKPLYEQEYYIADITLTEGYIKTIWWDDHHDEKLWSLSMVHSSAEAAKAHAEAMLKHDVTYG